MRTKDVLKQALQDFDGTLIVVSHDRDFLDGLVSKVYEFGGGKVTEHLEGIYESCSARSSRISRSWSAPPPNLLLIIYKVANNAVRLSHLWGRRTALLLGGENDQYWSVIGAVLVDGKVVLVTNGDQ